MDKERFVLARTKVLNSEMGTNGIGTLGEKTLHAVIKNYLEPEEQYQEVQVNGYVADICRENQIWEVQTRNFNTLRRKLETFLPEHKVTIVYPIASTKWLVWMNPETGEVSDRRKSPKRGTPFHMFKELYRIKMYLNHPNLRIQLLFLDVEETRLLNGWSEDHKKGSTRYDGFPVALVDELSLDCTLDYRMMLPIQLPEEFTTKDYAKVTKLPIGQARTAVHIMNYLKVIDKVGKDGNTFLYRLTEDSLT